MARQRNNVTRLSAEIRLRVCKLFDDGATQDEVRMDLEVASECKEKHLTLHNNSFRAYIEGDEYNKYCKRRHALFEQKQTEGNYGDGEMQ